MKMVSFIPSSFHSSLFTSSSSVLKNVCSRRNVHSVIKRSIRASTTNTSSNENHDSSIKSNPSDGIRINKCFKSFASRRESDQFVFEKRVSVNGKVIEDLGTRVNEGDIVKLDGKTIQWERLTLNIQTQDLIYLKHWKTLDTICTTDLNIPENIIDYVYSSSPSLLLDDKDRIFPIGRLDQSSTGIILLTSDGRLPNKVLGKQNNCEKTYLVTSDLFIPDEHIEQLRNGVDISTVAQRDRQVRKTLVTKTIPCSIERCQDSDYQIYITLKEGRNRQLRKMLGALGYTTRAIHRISFMDITLDGLEKPGDSCYLNDEEMKLIKDKLEAS